jgi:hypothetical protein
MITPTQEFWKVFKETNGALSCTEAVAIMNIAAQAPEGLAVELGTHKGKSAMAASFALNDMTQFYLVEPEFSDSKWFEDVYNSILKSYYNKPKNILLKPFADYSTNVISNFNNISYCFVDSGSHQDGLPMQEVKLLEDKMVQGGIICFHDWDSQFREVKEASDYLVSTGKYDYISIQWNEIIEYVNANNLEEGNISWHHNELKNPQFVGAVRRK